jgi:hypothetical protein
MAGFLFRLETVDGAPAEPPTFATAVPNWWAGDVISLARRQLRVIGKGRRRSRPTAGADHRGHGRMSH